MVYTIQLKQTFDEMKKTVKENILFNARLLFVEKGFKGTSIREIAQHSQVNISAISYYFKGKKQLYFACMEEFGEQYLELVKILDQRTLTEDSFKNSLEDFLKGFLSRYYANPELICLVLKEIEAQGFKNFVILETVFLKIYNDLVHFFQLAKNEHLIKASLSEKILSQIFIGLILQAISFDKHRQQQLNVSLLHDQSYREEYITNLLEIFIDGIEKK